MTHLTFRVLPALLALTALAACQSVVDVRRVATDGAPAYDLRGGDLGTLQARAEALCPHGYQPVREWERQPAAPGDDNVLHRSWTQAQQTLGLTEPAEAQLLVQCRA